MKDKIQKLCKRLNRFTLEEIALIVEMDEVDIEPILEVLVDDDILIKNDDCYSYNHIDIGNMSAKYKLKKQLPPSIRRQPTETVNALIRCFCAGISPYRTSFILKAQKDIIIKVVSFLKEAIYEKQKEELLIHFERSPQMPIHGEFFDKIVHFYTYNHKLYVSKEILVSKYRRRYYKSKIGFFNIIYPILLNKAGIKGRYYPHLYVAEQLWRRDKDIKQLQAELESMIKIN